MSSSPARDSNPSSTPTPSRSLLSRLKSPLQKKARNFVDFHIQPDDPHRQYAPGDIISGTVKFTVLKPIRITHLVISLHGYAQVFKNPNSPGDAYKAYSSTVGTGKGKKSGSYFGNGFASLFEDEAVLCGEGRLGEGIYHFNFELEFPPKGLPSSIDFERGTITYMLTATLTRPTTISPTSSADTKVFFTETIDVAPIPEPKPRSISLEPISRRGRARKQRSIAETTHQEANKLDPVRSSGLTELNSVAGESDTPGSPAPSDVSFESRVSSGGASGTEYGVRSNKSTELGTLTVNGSRTVSKDKTITATVHVLKGGFLRGDQIPVKVAVSHTKHVRSLKGIIITLYRQARVDMHPALPMVTNNKSDKTKSEDYYPKSRTGLGGLSLSSAGSSRLFRKDLSQSFAPLFVDPRTLTAEVKCGVRVPDEAFPSISSVPGAMISFKYYVEVVVDIQGKLAGLDRLVTNSGIMNTSSFGGSAGATEDTSGGIFSTWGSHLVDTEPMRREKGIISCNFDVVIGTKDSDRNGKKKMQQTIDLGPEGQPGVHDIQLGPSDDQLPANGGQPDYYGYDQDGQYYDQYGYSDQYPGYHAYGYPDGEGSQPVYAPPAVEEEQGLSEKERLQRAEARLLPSQPPGAGASSSLAPTTSQPGIPASAPVLPEDDDPNPPYVPAESTTQSPPPPFAEAASSSRPPPTQRQTTNIDGRRASTTGSATTINADAQPSRPPTATRSRSNSYKALPPLPPPSHAAPGYSQAAASSSAHVEPTDDKQELQRRRLEMERSAPPDETLEDALEPSAPSGPPAVAFQDFAPSAPILDDDDEGLVGHVETRGHQRNRPTSEALPEYRR